MTYFEELAKKDSEQLFAMMRGKDTEFSKDHVLFVQRDMFNDSCFPAVVLPADKDAMIAFFIYHHRRVDVLGDGFQEYRLKISEYGGEAIVAVHYEHVESHWVQGFIRYGLPEGMELPFEVRITEADLKRFEGWSAITVRERDPESRTEGDVHLWVKDESAGRKVYMSDRDIPLLCQEPDDHDRITVTMEDYCKWYGVHLLHPDGRVEKVHIDLLLELEEGFRHQVMSEHNYHPQLLNKVAEHYKGCVDLKAFEMTAGRWVIEVDESLLGGIELEAPYAHYEG